MKDLAEIKKLLNTNPAHFIEQEIKEFVRTSPDNRLGFLNDYAMWGEPLVGFADGDDLIFSEFKSVVDPEHLTPREALARTYDKDLRDMTGHISVISWILPAAEETRRSNRTEDHVPSRLWSHTRWYGEMCNEKLRTHVVDILNGSGYLATAPFLQAYFKIYANEKGPYSNWSERHMAYAAGLGTFSLSDGLITERGIAIRCGSVVTNLALPASARKAESPFSNCLFYAGIKCRACIERCPAGAISENGHDKKKCQRYLHGIGYMGQSMKYDNEKSIAGCGLCQTKVPCEYQNPTRRPEKTE